MRPPRRPGPLALLSLWVAAAVAAALRLVGPLPAAEPRPTEYEVKAAFLYNFARFVEWPADRQEEAVHIGILGEDPFGAVFEAILGTPAKGRPVVVERAETVDAARRCHILFVSRSEERRLPQILQQLGTWPVLTVSDGDDFARRGGMIGFVIRQNKVRFQINAAAAERAGVRLSARLLRLAERVDEGR